MAGLLDFFFTSFIPKLKPEDSIVDIKPLVEFWLNCSHITLNYNRDELRPTILSNFCASYQQKGIFPYNGIYALKSILNRDINDNSIAQWCLSVHFTKVNDDKGKGIKLTYLLMKLSTMTVDVPDQYQMDWIELAKKVVNHKQIKLIVARVLQKFGIEAKAEVDMRFVVVSNEALELIGFSGLDTVYINRRHFESTFQSNYSHAEEHLLMTEMVELAAKMSLIALTIHEFGHVKLRQACGNFNVSTSKLAKDRGLPDNHKELGVLCEIETFMSHADWNQSQFTANVDFMRSFVRAIETGAELPKGAIGIIANRRESECFSSGVDMEEAFTVYE